MEQAKVSVLLPVYNAEDYLESSVESILSQTYEDFEFIIVEDGSSDNTWEILQTFKDSRIKLFKNERNLGFAKTLNKGISHCEGDIIFRQDADDYSFPDRLEKQLDFFEKNRDYSIVATNGYVISEKGIKISFIDLPLVSDKLLSFFFLFDNPLIHTSIGIRKKALTKLGNYPLNKPFVEDFYVWSKALRGGYKIKLLDEFLVSKRAHTNSMTTRLKEEGRKAITPILEQNYEFIYRKMDSCEDIISISHFLRYCESDRNEKILCQTFFRIMDEYFISKRDKFFRKLRSFYYVNFAYVFLQKKMYFYFLVMLIKAIIYSPKRMLKLLFFKVF